MKSTTITVAAVLALIVLELLFVIIVFLVKKLKSPKRHSENTLHVEAQLADEQVPIQYEDVSVNAAGTLNESQYENDRFLRQSASTEHVELQGFSRYQQLQYQNAPSINNTLRIEAQSDDENLSVNYQDVSTNAVRTTIESGYEDPVQHSASSNDVQDTPYLLPVNDGGSAREINRPNVNTSYENVLSNVVHVLNESQYETIDPAQQSASAEYTELRSDPYEPLQLQHYVNVGNDTNAYELLRRT